MFISIFYLVNIEYKPLDITLRIIACIAFPIMLLPFKVYEQIEIITAKNFIKKYLKINV
jgi:hypothetical protein